MEHFLDAEANFADGCLLMKMNIVGKVIEHNFKCNNFYKFASNFISQNMEIMLKFNFKGFHS